MAQYLKVLIRTSVVLCLNLEHKGLNAITDMTDIWNSFIQDASPSPQLVYLAPLPNTTMQLLKKEPLPMDRLIADVHADLCTLCRQTVDDDAIVDNLIGFRWHAKCFPLDKKSREIIESTWKSQNKNLNFEQVKSFGYTKISHLQQYIYLLRVALRRLTTLLLVAPQDEEVAPVQGLARRVSQRFKKDDQEENPLEQRPRSPSIGNLLKKSPSKKKLTLSPSKPDLQSSLEKDAIANTTPAVVAAAPEDDEPVLLQRKLSTKVVLPQWEPVATSTRYLSELSSLEHIIVQHFAVLMISPYLVDMNKQELLDAIGNRKEALLLKLTNKVKKKPLFNTPLDILVNKYGTDSNLGAGPGRLRIPIFIDKTIKLLKQKNLYTEGIFRLNGNIKKLKETCDLLDKDPTCVDLDFENEIQLAAIMKKFLRELPEPLMTFKLYKLFISIISTRY